MFFGSSDDERTDSEKFSFFKDGSNNDGIFFIGIDSADYKFDDVYGAKACEVGTGNYNSSADVTSLTYKFPVTERRKPSTRQRMLG